MLWIWRELLHRIKVKRAMEASVHGRCCASLSPSPCPTRQTCYCVRSEPFRRLQLAPFFRPPSLALSLSLFPSPVPSCIHFHRMPHRVRTDQSQRSPLQSIPSAPSPTSPASLDKIYIILSNARTHDCVLYQSSWVRCIHEPSFRRKYFS